MVLPTTKRRQEKPCFKNDLVFVGIPFLIVQVFLFREQLVSYSSSITPIEIDDSPLQQQQQRQVQQKIYQRKNISRIPDGIFNGYPVYYHDIKTDDIQNEPPPYHYSQIHCTGDFYSQPPLHRKAQRNLHGRIDFTWMHRSCHFSLLCFDTEENDFVIFQDPQEQNILESLRPTMNVEQSYLVNKTPANKFTTGVSVGGINLKWTFDRGIFRLKWFPRIVSGPPPHQFYTLPSNVVMVPFHSLAAFNPGHLVWDEWLPIYTLLDMFQLLPNQADLLLMRYVLPGSVPGSGGLWASCDFNEQRSRECAQMHNKFQPLLIRNPNVKITNQHDFEFQRFRPEDETNQSLEQSTPQSHLVCAKDGLAGLGSITDHGTRKIHGWEAKDYQISHNHGRGGLLWKFRNYMMANLGIANPSSSSSSSSSSAPTLQSDNNHLQETTLQNNTTATSSFTNTLQPPYKIVFSMQSSKTRMINLYAELEIVRQNISSDLATAEGYTFKKLSLHEQATIASQAAIYVTGCGGGAVTAMFLPRGASLFVFFNPHGGVNANNPTGLPARLDWDLFNHLNYIRVHWIPETNHRNDKSEFLQLIQHELNIIQRESE